MRATVLLRGLLLAATGVAVGVGSGAGQEPDTLPDPGALRAEADAAWREREPERARRLYGRILEADSTDVTALHRLGVLEGWAGGYDRAQALLDRALERDPGNAEVLVDRARVLAWRGQPEAAAAALEGVLDAEPGHGEALEALARVRSWGVRPEPAASTAADLVPILPTGTELQRARDRVLSRSLPLDEARAAFDARLERDPSDTGARLGLARVLAFSGRLDSARATYRDVLRREPANGEALRGLARALGWDGDLRAAEEVWRDAVGADPDDVPARVGLARNLGWQGRHAEALRVLAGGREVVPEHPEIREQLRWTLAAVSPRVRPSYEVEDDSDGNGIATSALTAEWEVAPGAALRVGGYRRDVEQAGVEGTAQGFVLAGSYDFARGWTASLGAGASEFDLGGRASAFSYRASLTTPRGFPYGATLRHEAGPLDASAALVQRDVYRRRWQIDARWSPSPAWRLEGSATRARYEGSSVNHRHGGGLVASRTVAPSWTLGAGVHAFSFQEDAADGYYDPDFYGLAELAVRWQYGGGGWLLRLEGAPGLHHVGEGDDPAATARGSLRLTRRIGPGRELFVSAGYSSASLRSFATADADYRYAAISVGGAWAFY